MTETKTGEEMLDRMREFLRAKVCPLEDDLLAQRFDTLLPRLHEKRRQVKDMGLWAPALPREFGGMGLPFLEFAPVSEVLGSSPLGLYCFNCQAPDIGNMELLLHAGSPEQKATYLRPLAAGDIRSCFSMAEPEHAGSNPVHMSTTAVRDGDEYVIEGHKWFSSACDGAAFAIVMALTNPDAENPYQRASQIIVPTDTPGFERVRNIPLMGDVGADYFSHSEVRFHGCRVPVTNRIGEEGSGFELAQRRLGPGRIHHCMRWIGVCERAFEMMCRRAGTRELAPGQVLAEKQTIQNWIAESRVEIDAARMLTLNAARRIDAEGQKAARIEISSIKFFVAGVMDRVVDRAVQVHGALGVSDDTILSWWYRHERPSRIYDGADEVHKSVVAREALKAYGIRIPR